MPPGVPFDPGEHATGLQQQHHGPGGDHQRVEQHPFAIAQINVADRRVEIDNLAAQHDGVPLAGQDAAEGGSNVRRGQRPGGDLGQERLEQVEVPPVD
jgi:hypothetical protein